MEIGILHYAGPPTVGGVEITLAYHARILTDLGHRVTVLAGSGGPFDPRVAVRIVPELGSRHPEVLAVKAELDQGRVTDRFRRLRDRIRDLLAGLLAPLDVLIAHNLFTLHKNLALTAALHALIEEGAPLPRILAWHHDLAWVDPQYADQVHPGYPWDLLRTPWPGVVHVTVSEPRREELARLYGLDPEGIHVVPPGVDGPLLLGLTPRVAELARRLGWWEADLLLLTPARITRRKNHEQGLRILAALRRRSGWDARLLVTGPPGAHNPTNAAYLERLLSLRRELGLEGAAHFLYELGEGEPLRLEEADVAALYRLADALLFPTRHEGFGMPVLEAGLSRLPVFASRIPPLQASGGAEALYFDPDGDPEAIAARILAALEEDRAFRLRRRVRRHHRWEAIVRERILPLVEGGPRRPAPRGGA